MMSQPDVSVVMSVFNGGISLARTIESVLMQSGVSLEFIIVDDGSEDSSRAIVQGYAEKDNRIQLIEQENRGLTQALIVGCARATGKYIARQDVGDVSLPGRLQSQFEAICKHPNASLLSTATRFETPDGEHLYTVSQTSAEATQGLNSSATKNIKGPSHHGSTMFPRESYELVGGYRPEFFVAQDLDLWIRLAESGEVLTLEQTYYCATVEKNSISSERRDLQVSTTEYILRCRKARNSGISEQAILQELSLVNQTSQNLKVSKRTSDAAYYYFLASNLLDRGTPASLKYFYRAAALSPFNIKILIKLVYAHLRLLIRSDKD